MHDLIVAELAADRHRTLLAEAEEYRLARAAAATTRGPRPRLRALLARRPRNAFGV